MKYAAALLFLLTVCVSCNSFQHMQYRKLKKVPADNFFVASAHRVAGKLGLDEILTDTITVDSGFVQQQPVDSAAQPEIIICENPEPEIVIAPAQVVVDASTPIQNESGDGADLHRDWSWVIALLMILGGLYIIAYIIFAIPVINILMLQIVISLLLLYAAVKLIVKGIAILHNRVHRPKTYKEK